MPDTLPLPSELVCAQYDYVSAYRQGLFFVSSVRLGVLYTGLYNSHNNTLVYPVEYTHIRPSPEHINLLLLEKVSPKLNLKDQDGRYITYRMVSGLGNDRGEIIQPCMYDWITYHESFDLFVAKKHDEKIYIPLNGDGSTLLPLVEYQGFVISEDGADLFFIKDEHHYKIGHKF